MQRFWDKVHVDPDGCWLWTAAEKFGYGCFFFDGRMVQAHRFAYELVVGEIPEGLVIDHLCQIKLCVRPDHLEAVTHRENVLRSPRGFAAINARKNECHRGHPLSGDNLYLRPTGARECKECRTMMSAPTEKEGFHAR